MRIEERHAQYTTIRLEPDLSALSDEERAILPLLIEAARALDDAFWTQNYGDKAALLSSIPDPRTREYALLSYGPWDGLRDNEPFVAGVGPKPAGANFYPPDLMTQEFESGRAIQPDLASAYTMVRRDSAGNLVTIPYHRFFERQVRAAADKLRQAAAIIRHPTLKAYLTLRADALLNDHYRASDLAWMAMKDNALDILIGPMETSADGLFGQKTAYAGTVLVKDVQWSNKLSGYAKMLPRFQDSLPVPDAYKHETPGLESSPYVYDVVYCAGYDNASIPLGVNWPNDEEVRAQMGTRSMQLKNTIRAKFERLVVPMASMLMARQQLPQVTFEAYFNFVLFHEIAHGLGIRQTIAGTALVADAMLDLEHVIEECKANLLSLFLMAQVREHGDMSEAELHAGYVSGLAHLLRLWDTRQACLQLNMFQELGAYSRDAGSGTYHVHVDRLQAAVSCLAERVLRLQGDGDYAGARALVDRYAHPDENLQADMARFRAAGHPLEITLLQT